MATKKGRPTLYSTEMQKLADNYIDGGYEDSGDAIPSIAGMASRLGVTRQTLYNWRNEHGQFLDTLEQCECEQERVTLSKGLKGEFNASIAKLILHNHGYSDKQQREYSGSVTGPIEPKPAIEYTKQELAEIIARGE